MPGQLEPCVVNKRIDMYESWSVLEDVVHVSPQAVSWCHWYAKRKRPELWDIVVDRKEILCQSGTGGIIRAAYGHTNSEILPSVGDIDER